jgi:hypothetical protein
MPETTQHIDLDDTAGCPLGRRCESCGTEAGPLAVETASAARLGVLCMTLYRQCAAYDDQRNGAAKARALYLIAALVDGYPGIRSRAVAGQVSDVLDAVAIELGNGSRCRLGCAVLSVGWRTRCGGRRGPIPVDHADRAGLVRHTRCNLTRRAGRALPGAGAAPALRGFVTRCARRPGPFTLEWES